jgi:HlyD family secretion protein
MLKASTVAGQRAQTNQRRQALLVRQAISVEAAEEAQLNEAVANADVAVAESEIASAKARLDDARAQHEFEKVVLDQHDLRAPFDGLVVARARELGSVLAAGETLFTMVAPETVWVLAYIDEGRAGDIRVGHPAEIRLRSLPGRSFKGRVSRIGIESDRVNEERRVYVACDACPESFFLGEQAEVFITTAVLPRAILVPEAAVTQSDGGSGLVWTVDDGRLKRQRVALGARTLDSRIEVKNSEARIVSAVVPGLAEGRRVRIAGE